ncbi:acyltransferase family protein [Actinoplanes sp. NPDC051494]|uniref:acyltransferase family protein n=1 Tax=Actinoplanes sp. NPDC051494 TaxID=3363907 RepID=UPI0037BA0B9E
MVVLLTPQQRRPAGQPSPPRKGRIAVLDGLRLVAALTVVSYHFTAYDRGQPKWWGGPTETVFPTLAPITAYGWLGVELFFLISGFVICMSAWGRSLGDFLRSRIVRLYPAYWAAVLLTFSVLTLWPIVRQPVSGSEMLVNLTMLHEPLGISPVDAVYWTLWVEARFYLLFALVVWRGLTVRRAVLFAGGWLVAAAIATQADVPALNVIVMPDYAPYFSAGIALFLIHRFGSHIGLWGLVGASFLMAQHHAMGQSQHIAEDILRRPMPAWPALIIVATVFAAMAVVATGRLDGIQWKWLTVAGALTYPLYLVHEYIGWTLIYYLHEHLNRYLVLATAVTAVLLLAWLIHKLVERPLSRILRDRLKRPISQ